MTEDEAFNRITEIGQAFANDLNDGDGPVIYEGLSAYPGSQGGILEYQATLDDGSTVTWRWHLTAGVGVVNEGD